jgi:DNA-binding CsgD family transcriptional regulator
VASALDGGGDGGVTGAPTLDWERLTAALLAHPHRLCPKQALVLRGIVGGRTYRAMATLLNCSPHTIRSDWERLKVKIRVATHKEAVHFVYGLQRAMIPHGATGTGG